MFQENKKPQTLTFLVIFFFPDDMILGNRTDSKLIYCTLEYIFILKRHQIIHTILPQ